MFFSFVNGVKKSLFYNPNPVFRFYAPLSLYYHLFFPLLCATLAARWLGFNAHGLELASTNAWLLARGIVSDTIVSLILSLIICSLFKRTRSQFICCLLWCILLAFNAEFIAVNVANLNTQFLFMGMDKTFITSSVLTEMIGIKIILIFTAFLAARWCINCVGDGYTWITLSICIIAASSVFLLPKNSGEGLNWERYNMVEENITNWVMDIRTNPLSAINETSEGRILKFYEQDLKAPSLVTHPTTKPNILILTIESLSQGHMDRGWTPNLKILSEQGLHYPYYLTGAAVTINGLYAMFCGDYPSTTEDYMLDMSKADFVANGRQLKLEQHGKWNKRKCLPNILNDNGYNTLYFGAAPLGFQHKNVLIPKMGFKTVNGSSGQKNWGYRDGELYTYIYESIVQQAQNESKKPWLINAMTVSTHPPYDVPDEFMPELEKKERGYRYMDDELNKLINKLKSGGYLDNTLVIITGDESRDKMPNASFIQNILQYNHGFMLILTPTKEQKHIDTIYTQMDLQISILDYLDIKDDFSFGRSLFRSYDTFRPLLFINNIHSYVFIHETPDRLLRCDTYEMDCMEYVVETPNIFNSLTEKPLGNVSAEKIMFARQLLNITQNKQLSND
jgi:hypothetical protein